MLTAVEHPSTESVKSVSELLEKLRANPKLGDVTLENVQARMRTLVLMTIANQVGGIVLGTGDLSEKALGWCTYSGDHIANYDINCGVPKVNFAFWIMHNCSDINTVCNSLGRQRTCHTVGRKSKQGRSSAFA